MEISHHVRGKAMGMNMERPENVVLVLPKAAAVRLVNGKTENDRQAALLDGKFFINGEPFILYLSDEAAQESARIQYQKSEPAPGKDSSRNATPPTAAENAAAAQPIPAATPDPPPAPRDISPESLSKIQSTYQQSINQAVKDLDSQAHFVTYAAPAMVAFRKLAYLELSLNTTLPPSATGSRYKMAALAFDEHIAHLVRPAIAYFKGDLEFDGIAFSTTIHMQEKAAAIQGNEAVEFFFPISALRCYEAYDCTGQQLIDRGSVLINGERVSLDLQSAEAGVR